MSTTTKRVIPALWTLETATGPGTFALTSMSDDCRTLFRTRLTRDDAARLAAELLAFVSSDDEPADDRTFIPGSSAARRRALAKV